MKADPPPSTSSSSSSLSSTPPVSTTPSTKPTSTSPNLSITSNPLTPTHHSPTTTSLSVPTPPSPSSSTIDGHPSLTTPPSDLESHYRSLEVHGLFAPSSNIIMDDDILQLASLFTIHEIVEYLNEGKVRVSAKVVRARVQEAVERIARRRRVGVERVVRGLEERRGESGVLIREGVQRSKRRGWTGGVLVFPGLGGVGNRDACGGGEVEVDGGVAKVEGEG